MSEQISSGEAAAQPSSPDEKNKTPTRVIINDGDLSALSSNDLINRWRQQEIYVNSLEQRVAQQEGENNEQRQTIDKLKAQLSEIQQREKTMVRRLAAKEQEMQDYMCQLNELKSAQVPTGSSLRSALLDPAVNSLLQYLRTEIKTTRSTLEDTQNELAAWKFTPDSNTGKRLMAKCRLLHQENDELGKITSSGRIALLEGDLALQKSLSEEVRQSQLELDSFLADLDEDVEGMQSTILFLQQELRKAKDTASVLQKENNNLKVQNGGRANGDSVCGEQTRTDSDSDNNDRTRIKRVRRSSVLSIDYNEDDTLVINSNGDVAMSDAE